VAFSRATLAQDTIVREDAADAAVASAATRR
jgi:hypothetical protein